MRSSTLSCFASSEPGGAPPAGGRSHAESEFRGLASTRVLPCTSVVEAASLGSARRRIAAHSSALSALWAMKARGAELSASRSSHLSPTSTRVERGGQTKGNASTTA